MNLVQTDSVHEILCPKNPQELAHVELRYKHLLVAFDDFADIARQRIQIAQVQMANLASSGARRFDGRGDGAGSRAPRNDKQVACGIAFGQHIGNVLAHGGNFCRADTHHVLVVKRLVVHVAGAILLFQAANAVLESRSAGERPGPSQRLRIALVRHEADRIGGEFDGNGRNVFGLGDAPRFGTVGKVAVGKDNHGNHVLQRDPRGFESDPKAIAGSGCREYGDRCFRVAAKERLQKIRLLGLRGQAGRGAPALNVTNDQRDLGGDRKAKGFRF